MQQTQNQLRLVGLIPCEFNHIFDTPEQQRITAALFSTGLSSWESFSIVAFMLKGNQYLKRKCWVYSIKLSLALIKDPQLLGEPTIKK